MTKYTSPHNMPYPEQSDLIAKAASPEDTIRADFEALATASNREFTTAARATQAVAQNLETQPERLDIISGDDTRSMAKLPIYPYAYAVVDKDGRVAGGVTSDGKWNFETPPEVSGNNRVTMHPAQDPDVAWAVVDNSGQAAIAVYQDGSVFVSGIEAGGNSEKFANDFIGYTRSSRKQIACVGDSQTISLGGGWPESETYPGVLRTLVPSTVSVHNLGRSGYTVDEESISIGALPLEVTVSGGVIPASGPVDVLLSAGDDIGWRPLGTTRSFSGSLAGVKGTLVREASNTSLTFTRSTPGETVSVSGQERWVSDWAVHDSSTVVVQLGRNDVSYGVSGTEGDVVTHVVNGYRRIHDFLKPQIKQFLALSVTNSQNETAGTAGYEIIMDINAKLAQNFGPRYLDFRTRLVRNGLEDASISPTPDDAVAIAQDAIPPSLMDDNVHYNRKAASLVAQYAFEYLSTREWISE